MFVHLCLGLLALSAVTTASDPTCDELVKPMTDRNLLSGKWLAHAGTTDNEDFMTELKKMTNSWIQFTIVPDSDSVSMKWADKIDGKCTYENASSSFPRDAATVESQYSTPDEDHSEKYLQTCPDCLLLVDHMTAKIPNLNPIKGRFLFLLTRTTTVDDAQLEVFKKQAACLNFTKEILFGDNTDLCPEEVQQ